MLIYQGMAQRGASYGLEAQQEIRFADAPGIGANTFLHREPDPEKVRRELQVLRSSGIGIIRQEFQWVEIEPSATGRFEDSQGASTWTKYDGIVEAARSADIEILARLDRPPAWATPGFDPQANPSIQAPPADNAAFATFAAAVAHRYRGTVRYFQIWNEPNLFGEWGGQSPDPAAYLAMLRDVGAAIRAANPEAVIVLAGLAPTIETGPQNISDLIYLRRLYELGAKGAFDVAASMSYGLFTGPRDVQIHPLRTNFPRAVLWRDIMVEFGDTSTPIWAAEYGWMSLPSDWVGEPGIWGNHSGADQAAWTVDGIRRAREQWPWMPTIIIWASRWPEDAHPRDPTPYFRLLEKDLTPRPPLDALRRAFAGPPTAGVGLHQESNPALSFEGPWPRVPSDDASLGFHRQTGVVGAVLRLRFEGSELSLLTRRGPGMGQLRVRIDGHDALPDLVPHDASGEAIIDLYAPIDEKLVKLPIASRLPEGPHEAEFTLLQQRNSQSTGGLVIVDGVLVANTRPLTAYLAILTAWLIAGGLALWHAGPDLRHLAPRVKVSLEPLDRVWVFGVTRGELFAAALAIGYLVLPGGGLTSPSTIVRMVIVAGLGALALGRPMYVATAVMLTVPFMGVIVRTGVFDRPVAEIAVLVLAVAWILRCLWSRRFSRPSAGWTIPIVYLIAASVFAAIFADFQRPALRDLRTVILEPIALFWVISTVAESPHSARRPIIAFTVGAVAAALAAVILIPAGTVVTDAAIPRLRGLFGSPNSLALVLERGLLLAITFVFLAQPGSRLRRFGLAGVAVLVPVLTFTFSRGAWLGVIVGMLVIAVPAWRRLLPRYRVRWAAAAIATLAVVGFAFGIEGPAQALRLSDGTATSRLSIWDAAWRMVSNNFLFGVGPDNFLYQYRAYIRPDAWREPNISHPHNLLLDTWLSVGLFGTIAFAAILTVFAVSWWHAYRRSSGTDRYVLFGIAGSMTAILVHGLVDHWYFVPELAMIFWAIAAAVAVAGRRPIPVNSANGSFENDHSSPAGPISAVKPSPSSPPLLDPG